MLFLACMLRLAQIMVIAQVLSIATIKNFGPSSTRVRDYWLQGDIDLWWWWFLMYEYGRIIRNFYENVNDSHLIMLVSMHSAF